MLGGWEGGCVYILRGDVYMLRLWLKFNVLPVLILPSFKKGTGYRTKSLCQMDQDMQY